MIRAFCGLEFSNGTEIMRLFFCEVWRLYLVDREVDKRCCWYLVGSLVWR